jgi:hypothetical protein
LRKWRYYSTILDLDASWKFYVSPALLLSNGYFSGSTVLAWSKYATGQYISKNDYVKIALEETQA